MRIFLLSTAVILLFSFHSSANNFQNKLPLDTLKKGKNYFLFNKTENIETVSFSKNKKPKENKVFIRYGYPTPIPNSNSVNGTVLQSNRKFAEDGSLPVFDKIDIIKGKYTDIVMSKETKLRNLFTLTGTEFPLHLKLHSGTETVELELTEAGEWDISIELKNN